MPGGRGARARSRDRRDRRTGSGSRPHRSRDARRAGRRPRANDLPLPAGARLRAGGGGRPADHACARQPRVPARGGVRLLWRRSRSSTWRFASPTSRASRRSAGWRSPTAARPLGRLGRFDEAVADLEAARDLYRRLGSRLVAYPLANLGHVYRWRGQWALARVAYEEAIANAEASGDLQALVPALPGLARGVGGDDAADGARLWTGAGRHPATVQASVARARLGRRVALARVTCAARRLRPRERVAEARAGPVSASSPRRSKLATLAHTAARRWIPIGLERRRGLPGPRQPPRRGAAEFSRALSPATRREQADRAAAAGRWEPVDTGRRSPCSFPIEHGTGVDRRPYARPVSASSATASPTSPRVQSPQGPRPVQDPGRPARPPRATRLLRWSRSGPASTLRRSGTGSPWPPSTVRAVPDPDKRCTARTTPRRLPRGRLAPASSMPLVDVEEFLSTATGPSCCAATAAASHERLATAEAS